MKNMNWMVVVAMVAMVAGVAQAAPELRALSGAEQALWQATHAVDIVAADLTTTATNTTQVFSVAVSSNTYVSCMGAKLLAPFDVGVIGTNTFYTSSLTLIAGDTNGASGMLASMQMAKSNSPVFWKPAARTGTPDNPTNVSVVTLTAGTYYTANTNLYFTVTPGGIQAVATNRVGAVKVLFQLR